MILHIIILTIIIIVVVMIIRVVRIPNDITNHLSILLITIIKQILSSATDPDRVLGSIRLGYGS